MSRTGPKETVLHRAQWRGRVGWLLVGIIAALLADEVQAVRTNTAAAPSSSTQTNHVVASAISEFNPQLVLSVYKPTKMRDPFLKPGTAAAGGALKLLTAGQIGFHLQAIFWSPTEPSAVVNDQLLSLNKSVVFRTASGDAEVKAVKITRDGVVLEVAGQQVELKLNPE